MQLFFFFKISIIVIFSNLENVKLNEAHHMIFERNMYKI